MNVLFLDIDGVLQPYSFQDRFNHDLDELQKELAVKYNDEAYLQMDKYDLGAVFYDWYQPSLDLLKKVLDDNKCKIVVHSGWRIGKNKGDMARLLKLHGLDKYYIDDVGPEEKPEAIKKYIATHPEITNYVVVDDDTWTFKNFGDHLCLTDISLTQEDVDRINQIFNNLSVDQNTQ